MLLSTVFGSITVLLLITWPIPAIKINDNFGFIISICMATMAIALGSITIGLQNSGM